MQFTIEAVDAKRETFKNTRQSECSAIDTANDLIDSGHARSVKVHCFEKGVVFTRIANPSLPPENIMDKEDEIKVTVCDSCLTACCWQGLFYCDKYREAGIVSKTVGELKTLDLENPCYWDQGQKLESTPP